MVAAFTCQNVSRRQSSAGFGGPSSKGETPGSQVMFYTVAHADWLPGRPLSPSPGRPGLSRWRSEVEGLADGRALVAVAVRYDATRGLVVAYGTAPRSRPVSWSAPAIVGARGEVIVLAAVPAELVRSVGPARLRADAAVVPFAPRSHGALRPARLPFPSGTSRRHSLSGRWPESRRKSG